MISRPLHVCSLGYTEYEQDGRLRRMCEALAAEGHKVQTVTLPPRGSTGFSLLRGVEINHIDMPRHRGVRTGYFGSYLEFAARAAFRLAQLHRQHRFDVIHVNTMPDFMVFAATLPKLAGCRVLLDFHDMMPELYADKFGPEHHRSIEALRLVERTSARFADRVLAVHELHRRRLIANGIPQEKILTVMNVPDEAIFDERQPTVQPADHFVLAYHGTIAPRHGVDLAVRAFARARAQRPFMRFKIVGDGDGVDAVRAAIRDEGVESCVDFQNRFIPVHEVPSFLGDVTAGIISMRSSEATEMMLPVKLLEYARLGIAVLTPKTRTIAHYYDETSVCFTDPEDLERTAASLVALCDDPVGRKRQVERAAKIVEANSWNQQKGRYISVIRELASR